jgi:TfoX/Sxy family transcriptional regulator of competence genes
VPHDEVLAERVRALVADRPGFRWRGMFGGMGFLLHGNMCVGVWKDELIVRLSAEEADAALEQDGVRVFDITGRAMTGWVLVAGSVLASDEELEAWIDRAVAYVSLLPPKEGEGAVSRGRRGPRAG